MKNKIIFWGHVNEGEKVHLVSWDGETGSQYYKIGRTLIEYAVVATYEQLRDELITKKPVILCLEHMQESEVDKIRKKCQKVVFIPEMHTIAMDELINIALFSTRNYMEGNKTVLAGVEENAEHIALQVLKYFKFIEKAKKYELIIGSAESLNIDELSIIEDVVKEYSLEESLFFIEQVTVKEKEKGHCFILHVVC